MLLMSLPKLIPAVARHAIAYVDLAAADTRAAAHEATRRLVAMVIAAVAGIVALLMACVLVIALTWDGPYRVLAVGLMLATFGAAAIVAGFMATRRLRDALYGNVRAEWHKDQQLLRESFLDDSFRDERAGAVHAHRENGHAVHERIVRVAR